MKGGVSVLSQSLRFAKARVGTRSLGKPWTFLLILPLSLPAPRTSLAPERHGGLAVLGCGLRVIFFPPMVCASFSSACARDKVSSVLCVCVPAALGRRQSTPLKWLQHKSRNQPQLFQSFHPFLLQADGQQRQCFLVPASCLRRPSMFVRPWLFLSRDYCLEQTLPVKQGRLIEGRIKRDTPSGSLSAEPCPEPMLWFSSEVRGRRKYIQDAGGALLSSLAWGEEVSGMGATHRAARSRVHTVL